MSTQQMQRLLITCLDFHSIFTWDDYSATTASCLAGHLQAGARFEKAYIYWKVYLSFSSSSSLMTFLPIKFRECAAYETNIANLLISVISLCKPLLRQTCVIQIINIQKVDNSIVWVLWVCSSITKKNSKNIQQGLLSWRIGHKTQFDLYN